MSQTGYLRHLESQEIKKAWLINDIKSKAKIIPN
jgi:hypothetical protein